MYAVAAQNHSVELGAVVADLTTAIIAVDRVAGGAIVARGQYSFIFDNDGANSFLNASAANFEHLTD